MLNKRIFYIITSIIAVLGLLIYLSCNILFPYFGYKKYVSLQIILGVLQVVSVILCMVFTLNKPNKIALIVLFLWNLGFLIFGIVLLNTYYGTYKGLFIQSIKILLIMLAIAVIVFIIFYLPKLNVKYKKVTSIILCILLSVGILVGFTDLKNLRINYIKQGAVVYAVGETYQIVWTTEVKGTGYVEIAGLTFYDTVAGSLVSEQKVHKVVVPQNVLNEGKSYTVNTKKVVAGHGANMFLGGITKRSYNFRPVDESDGIQYFALSDTHDFNKVAAKPASYFGSKTDFVIMAGDIVDFLENESDLNRIVNLAYLMTKGNIPVVFARGNHEIKTERALQLYRYVGASGTDFYYSFRLGSVWGVVLDMGEYIDDSSAEFYGMVAFNDYRKAQVDFLENIVANKQEEYAADGVILKLGICHIPTSFIRVKNDYLYNDLVNLNISLNQMDLKCMLSGHLHQISIIENNYAAGMPLIYQKKYQYDTNGNPNFVATGASYYNVICSRSSRGQLSNIRIGRYFTGASFEYADNSMTLRFINDKLQVVSTISPFEDRDYGKEIIL